jgi:hypothetical protein
MRSKTKKWQIEAKPTWHHFEGKINWGPRLGPTQGFNLLQINPNSSTPCKILFTRVVSHCGLAIYITKYLNAKEELGNSNISPCKNIIFKNSSKGNQNPSRYSNSITNFKFQHNPKYHLSKILL